MDEAKLIAFLNERLQVRLERDHEDERGSDDYVTIRVRLQLLDDAGKAHDISTDSTSFRVGDR